MQLEDGSIVYPYGIIEDILKEVGKFVITAKLFVLDFVVDQQVPTILRRSFLTIEGAFIDVRKGTLKMRVDDEEVVFDVYKAKLVKIISVVQD